MVRTGRRRKRGRVYVIRHEYGPSKIGYASDPLDRLSALQTASPYNLNLFTTIDVVGDAEVVEKRLHQVHHNKNIRGEWFELSDDDLFTLAKLNEVHETVVDELDEWTPEKHLELTDEERDELFSSKLDEQIAEAVQRIRSGRFPRANLTDDNAAVKNWSEKAEVAPELFVEKVKEHDLPNV